MIMAKEGLRTLNVAVIGMGYVGLTTAVALAFLGHRVMGVEKDEAKLDLLRAGKIPFHEPGLPELLELARRNIAFTSAAKEAVAEADLIMIAVGTPQKPTGQADSSYVEEAAREVAQGLLPGRSYTIVVKSTVPIGTNRRVAHMLARVLAELGIAGQTHVRVASNPEFLWEGSALHDMFYERRKVP